MSLQSMVRLPNGELVSRNMDIHQILAANREQAPKETAPKKIPQEEIPVFGLLSRTVIRSPMINYIFPARIRHKDKNDVLFIGEDFIHIKEILPDGHLQHIFTKSDFGSRIRAAKVFGKQITPVLDTPEPDIKMENDAEENLETEVPVSFPPQVLILSLESKKLLFLFADQEASGKLNFVQSSLPLPSQRSFPEEPGKNIAVDPKSRAIAVSACENSVIVFVAKPLKDFWPKGGHLTGEWEPPIMRERPFQVKGVILRMEFLYPGPGDDDQVILLIIHAKAGRISFACFDWTHSRGLADAQNTCNKPTFERELLMPSLLIPLRFNSDFLMVCGHRVWRITDILSGSPKAVGDAQILSAPPRYPGNSKNLPVFTSWTRMTRVWKGDKYENFYLAREDGVYFYITVAEHGLIRIATPSGEFGYNVDTAFASLDVARTLDIPDILVAGGSSCDGGVTRIGAWKNSQRIELQYLGRQHHMGPVLLERIPNWAPIMDLQVTLFPMLEQDGDTSRHKMIVTSGRQPWGTISELRMGIQARLTFALEEEALTNTTGVWGFASDRLISLLISSPEQSFIVKISLDTTTEEANFDEESTIEVERNGETILFETLKEQWAIQITSKSIIILSIEENLSLQRRDLISPKTSDSVSAQTLDHRTITAAAVNSLTGTVLVAVRTSQRTDLVLGHVNQSNGEFNWINTDITWTTDEITCLTLSYLHLSLVALVGTISGNISFFKVDPDGKLKCMASITMQDSISGTVLAPCDSIVVLALYDSPEISSSKFMLACGRRQGDLWTVPFEIIDHDKSEPEDSSSTKNDGSSISFSNPIIHPFGNTTVRVIPNGSGPITTAFAMCGYDLCRLEYSSRNPSELSINSIWFTDPKRSMLQLARLASVSKIHSIYSAEPELEGTIVCLAGDSCYIAELDAATTAAPRRLEVPGTPQRIIVSPPVNKLNFTSFENEIRSTSRPPQRISRASVLNVNLVDYQKSRLDHEDLKIHRFPLWPSEKVYGMINWTLEQNGNLYAFLVLATGYQVAANGQQEGRVLFLQTKRGIDGEPYEKVSKVFKHGSPVYAIATIGMDIVSTSGTSISIHHFLPDERKWLLTYKDTLPSPGICITTSLDPKPIIFVSTVSDSIIGFQFPLSKPPSKDPPKLRVGFHDVAARPLTHHLEIPLITVNMTWSTTPPPPPPQPSNSPPEEAPIFPPSPSNSIILIADKTCTITGLYYRPYVNRLGGFKVTAPILFSHPLSRSITRLRRARIRPPWLRPDVPIPGIVTDDIIGSASDGSIFAFTILSKDATWMLKLLQNCMEEIRDRALGSVPLAETTKRKSVVPEADPVAVKRRTTGSVDGDVLQPLVEAGGEKALRACIWLISQEEEEEVWHSLVEVLEVLEPEVQGSTLRERQRVPSARDPIDVIAGVVQRLERYLRRVLRPVL